jgi:broad specificity phosphatase PhoE
VLFPDRIDEAYTSTLFPSRRGETLRDLQDRADLFVEAWTSRAEDMGLRTVVVFAHAASVIALGRAVSAAWRGVVVPLRVFVQLCGRRSLGDWTGSGRT